MTGTLVDAVSQQILHRSRGLAAPVVTGRVVGLSGLVVRVEGLSAYLGEVLQLSSAGDVLLAEVVAADEHGVACMALGTLDGVRLGEAVRTTGAPLQVPVGEELLGRVVDGLGRPIDAGPPLAGMERVAVTGVPPHPLLRDRVTRPLGLGARVLDTLTTCGRGQRLGIFAGSGVGKSTLLSMVARGTEADVAVLALVGERGREVREFLEHDLGAGGLARTVVVVATSDAPALVRLRAAFVATRIAEHFRDSGRHVVLMMDSLTRVAMAQREIGLSAGEPPTTRGYPPSVFGLLPRLLERAGAAEHGSITGLYTVLVDGDDHNEPIADAARSLLDGHVVLSRRLATAGHFPAVDVLESVSRASSAVTSREQRQAAVAVRRLLAAYRDARDLIEVGAYVPGTNLDVDRAVALLPGIEAFLRQDPEEITGYDQAWEQLAALGVDR
ncbi:MAG: FliI/YscN family ATPase [Actinomycetes bacterium]